jgi:murein DD-endopeptidase MepM/ murein hydrolase activator NlpD
VRPAGLSPRILTVGIWNPIESEEGMKKITITLISLSLVLVAPVVTASFLEDGPYLEMEEGEVQNFFLMDVGDAGFGLEEGNLPNVKPCDGIITSGFGWRRFSRRSRRGRMHKGLDIAAPIGTPIMAPADGKVAFVGRKGGYGKTVILDHGGGIHTLFAHNSRINVSEGEMVIQGQKISKVGSTGRSTGPHLHYEVRVQGQPVNPKEYF